MTLTLEEAKEIGEMNAVEVLDQCNNWIESNDARHFDDCVGSGRTNVMDTVHELGGSAEMQDHALGWFDRYLLDHGATYVASGGGWVRLRENHMESTTMTAQKKIIKTIEALENELVELDELLEEAEEAGDEDQNVISQQIENVSERLNRANRSLRELLRSELRANPDPEWAWLALAGLAVGAFVLLRRKEAKAAVPDASGEALVNCMLRHPRWPEYMALDELSAEAETLFALIQANCVAVPTTVQGPPSFVPGAR